MNDSTSYVGVAIIGVLIFAFAIWWKVSVWSECRTDHSFMYCMTMMGGK